MSNFHEITPSAVAENVFHSIGDGWMLITAAKKDGTFNTMTASWGGMGVLWGKNVAFFFIRPQRHTFGFSEEADFLSLSFFDEEYRTALNFCGSKSGRDVDKIAATGLTPVWMEGVPCFQQAKRTFVVKKMYADFFNPDCFIDPSIAKNYAQKDYHKMYIAEIVKVYE